VLEDDIRVVSTGQLPDPGAEAISLVLMIVVLLEQELYYFL
jgi:hypothetical protein